MMFSTLLWPTRSAETNLPTNFNNRAGPPAVQVCALTLPYLHNSVPLFFSLCRDSFSVHMALREQAVFILSGKKKKKV